MQQSITLESLLQQDSELSSLPEIYIRVSQLLDDDNTSASQIGLVVETDPALTTRILKMVNSAYYGFPKKISSISQAITILGRDRLKQILIGTVLGGVFGTLSNSVLSMEDFWYNSVKTAILARHLCSNSDFSEQADSIFTAALLHKIGRLVLAQQLPQRYEQVQQLVENEDVNLLQAETHIIGLTHDEVGAAFIEKWGLPNLLSNIARYHNHPEQADEFSGETRLVHLANHLVFLVSPIQQEVVEYALEDIEDWQLTGLSVDEITVACIYADEQVYDVMESLGMVQMRIALDDE